MPKERREKVTKRDPLEVTLREDAAADLEAAAALKKRKKAGRSGLKQFGGGGADGDDDGDDDDALMDGPGYVPDKVSRKILDQARRQAIEEGNDEEGAGGRRVRFTAGTEGGASSSSGRGRSGSMFSTASSRDGDGDGDEYEEEEEEIIEFGDEDDVRLDGDYVDLRGARGMGAASSAEDEAILRRFMPDAPAQRRTLADMIMDKIKEKEEEQGANAAAAAGPVDPVAGMDPKLVEVYTEVGRYLAHYKSGKLPKVLKIVPALGNWEEVLFLTNPETWTPHATYAVVRVFASNFNPAKAQRFFNLVLLPKCRDDIALNKRLNFHLYLALKKATYKPAAFYRGIILPLAASGDCTLREALIFGSAIAKSSLPGIHSAATLMKLASLWPYSGCVSIFLRLLLNKKYTLAFIAVDAVVDHFTRFMSVEGPLPVIWHQALLALAQRYKADLTREQKDGLKALMGVHAHPGITPEVRRELFSAGCRGDAPSLPVPSMGGAGGAGSGGFSAGKTAGGRGHQGGAGRKKAPASSSAAPVAMMDTEY